jgi:hypothetical protein
MIMSQERFLVKTGLIGLALVNTLLAWRLKEKSGKRRAGEHRRRRGYHTWWLSAEIADRPNLHLDKRIMAKEGD